MKRTRIALFILATALASPAQALDETRYLKDYIGLTKLLKSYGVEPAQVAWQEIEAMCLGINDPRDPVPYNQCRLEKSILQISYRDDRAVCDDEALAVFPSSLAQNRPSLIISETGGKPVDDNVTTITPQPYSNSNLRSKRRYIFDQCMLDKGWRNSRNYRLGMAR